MLSITVDRSAVKTETESATGEGTGGAEAAPLRLEFAGEWFDVPADRPFIIGREGDLEIDDNPYLHRHFLELRNRDGLWWLANVGVRLAATSPSHRFLALRILALRILGGGEGVKWLCAF
ncbi:hypothetical protein [Microbacterium sp.]|uniref:hypothetical protein n=1 Tax=Microbacterium sp. TaxID=51671 RepID=UPI0025D86C41|nr:hypothetical protein [Microbacterium sp.]